MHSILRVFTQRHLASVLVQQLSKTSASYFHQATIFRTNDQVLSYANGSAADHPQNELVTRNPSDIITTMASTLKIPYTDICAIPPTLSLVQHVNTSEVLSELVKLGVSIHNIDKTPGVRDWVLKLNMEDNIKPLIKFFLDQDISLDCVGGLINKCPYIMQLTPFQMERFVEYMKSKKFTPEMITRILMKSPHLLVKSIEKTDYHLGMLQKTFSLTGDKLRLIVTKEPKLVSVEKLKLEERNFSLMEEMGFDKFQLKKLILTKPRLWLLNSSSLANRFDYIHNTMELSHETIVEFPALLTCREFRLRARHQFLQFLGRAQYDPKLPRYVNPLQIIRDTDAAFAVSVAGSNLDIFNDFCKTL